MIKSTSLQNLEKIWHRATHGMVAGAIAAAPITAFAPNYTCQQKVEAALTIGPNADYHTRDTNVLAAQLICAIYPQPDLYRQNLPSSSNDDAEDNPPSSDSETAQLTPGF